MKIKGYTVERRGKPQIISLLRIIKNKKDKELTQHS